MQKKRRWQTTRGGSTGPATATAGSRTISGYLTWPAELSGFPVSQFTVFSFQFSASSSGPLWSTLCHALLTIVSQQIKKRLDTAQQPPAEICGDTFYANCSAHKNTHTHGCTVHTTHSHGAKVQSPQRKYSHEKRTQRCMWLPASI